MSDSRGLAEPDHHMALAAALSLNLAGRVEVAQRHSPRLAGDVQRSTMTVEQVPRSAHGVLSCD
jgi:hypothetical protein